MYSVNRRSLPTAVFHLVPRRRIFFFGDRPSFFDSLKKKKNVLTIQRLCILAYNITAIPRTGVQRKKELPPYGIAYVVYTIVFRPFFLFFFFSSARFFSLLPSSCSPTENRSCTRNHYKHSGTSRIKLFPGLLSFGRTIRNLPHHLRVEGENEKKKKTSFGREFFSLFRVCVRENISCNPRRRRHASRLFMKGTGYFVLSIARCTVLFIHQSIFKWYLVLS